MTFLINIIKNFIDGILEILLKKLVDRQIRRLAEKLDLDPSGSIDEISERIEQFTAEEIAEKVEEHFD